MLAGAPAGDPSSDRRQLEALREVADGEAVLGADDTFEVGTEHPGVDLDDARHGVDGVDTVEPGQVEHHTTVDRYRCAAHTTSSTGGGHGHE